MRKKLDRFKRSRKGKNLLTVNKTGAHWEDDPNLTSEEAASAGTINLPSAEEASARPWLWWQPG